MWFNVQFVDQVNNNSDKLKKVFKKFIRKFKSTVQKWSDTIYKKKMKTNAGTFGKKTQGRRIQTNTFKISVMANKNLLINPKSAFKKNKERDYEC